MASVFYHLDTKWLYENLQDETFNLTAWLDEFYTDEDNPLNVIIPHEIRSLAEKERKQGVLMKERSNLVIMAEAEYLAGELVPDVTYQIDDNQVKIASPSTVFANITCREPVDLKSLRVLYAKTVKMAKTRGLRCKYTLCIRRAFNERAQEYEKDSESALLIYRKIVKQAQLVCARGIHMGEVNDRELDLLYSLEAEYHKLFYCDRVLGQFMQHERHLTSLLQDLESDPCDVICVLL